MDIIMGGRALRIFAVAVLCAGGFLIGASMAVAAHESAMRESAEAVAQADVAAEEHHIADVGNMAAYVEPAMLDDPLWVSDGMGDAVERERAITASGQAEPETEMLAKTVWAEARGCGPEEQALVIWCILQRVDDQRWPDTIAGVLAEPSQFDYSPDYQVDPAILALCAAEMEKWRMGGEPPTHEVYAPEPAYFFFEGDGAHNYFRERW